MDVFREIFLMQQTYATLFSLANKLQVQGDKYFHGLTSRQFMTIIAIAHLPEDETTIINIARKLGTTKQSVKQLINAMEEKEYITIVPSQKDKQLWNVVKRDFNFLQISSETLQLMKWKLFGVY
jgi:Transcriptional regulators